MNFGTGAATSVALFALLVSLVLCCLPIIVAASRQSSRLLPVVFLDLFAGWTLVGWAVALGAWLIRKDATSRRDGRGA